jgi:hypothetical protein
MYQDFYEEDTKAKDNSPFTAEHKKMLADDEARFANFPVKLEEEPAATPQAAEPTQVQPEEPKEQSFPWEAGYDAGDAARNFAEVTLAAPTALVDFGTDVLNMIPGVDIPEIPEFKNEVVQGGRELASIILPNFIGVGAATRGIQALMKGSQFVSKAAKLGATQKTIVKLTGEAALAAGVGAGVDAISRTSEDHNALGQLKEMFPQHMQWIPDNIATLSSDDSNTKRVKNVLEGIGLGLFADLLLGAGKVFRSAARVRKYVPENEMAEPWKDIEKIQPGTAEEAVINSANAREKTLDELGAVNAYIKNMDDDLDTPVFGAEDVFNLDESGVRSADNAGVLGAAVDQVAATKNLEGPYSRLGSVATEGAIKYGLNAGEMTKRTLVKAIADQIKKGGKYSAELASGRKVTFEEIDEAGTRLSEIMMDPRMDPGFLKATLDEFKDEYNKLGEKVQALGDVGYNAAMKTIKGLLDEYLNMDTIKAQAYMTTSMGGQIADLAEGARLMEGTDAVARAQEQILDRVEYLMVEKGLAAHLKGQSLNFLNTWKRMRNDPKGLKAAAQATKDATDERLAQIVDSAKTFRQSMTTISKERPEFLSPLTHAYEYTDGDINTLAKLHEFASQSLDRIDKAFYDNKPEIPNQIVQGAWANIYNSVLTSFGTPLRAALGNSVLMLTKPISVFAGAATFGDTKTLQRGWYQYSAFMDTFQKGFKHMGDVFKKASTDPNSVGYIMRDDLVLKNEQTMETLREYALAAEKGGESGPLALYHMAETLQDIGNNPVLRFGANAMTALDGFTRAVVANAEARGRAFDQFQKSGKTLTGDELKRISDNLYNDMFDATGMITDEAVEYASREIALNLDNPAVKSISSFIERNKFMKPFLMFPRTSANMITMTNKFSPISLFLEDYNKLALPGQRFTADEIERILKSKGLPVTQEAFNNLRAEIRGRKAIGTATIMGAAWLFMNDRLHGNGHFDKERQRVRRQLNWQPRSYKGWDGNWYSYDGLGPMADFLALTADMMDNFDSVADNDLETSLNKMGFLLAANLTNKSMLAGLEPMNDVLTGNPAAMSRWAASFASSLVPLSGFRNELGKVIAPQLRELDQDFFQLLRNRNKYLDVVDPKGALPNAYDWIDGEPIGFAENFFTRGWNAIMPMKVSDSITPERQFLIDIEFDSRPTFQTNGKGIKYTPKERSELFSEMGRQKYFKREVQRIMKSNPAKEWRKALNEQRQSGRPVKAELWDDVYNQLDRALRGAKKMAEIQLSNYQEIRRRQFETRAGEVQQRRGEAPTFPLTNK